MGCTRRIIRIIMYTYVCMHESVHIYVCVWVYDVLPLRYCHTCEASVCLLSLSAVLQSQPWQRSCQPLGWQNQSQCSRRSCQPLGWQFLLVGKYICVCARLLRMCIRLCRSEMPAWKYLWKSLSQISLL